MNEEKFIQALRKSMEQERDIDFSLTAWQDLDDRLGKEKRKSEWKQWWWIFPLLVGIAIIIWQRKNLQKVQQQIEDFKEESSMMIEKKDTVFEKIIIYQYDTIRETIIEKNSYPMPIIPEDSFEQEAPKKQFGSSTSLSPINVQEIEIPIQEAIDHIAIKKSERFFLPKNIVSSNEAISFYHQSWNLFYEEKKSFDLDWFSIQLALDFDKNKSTQWKHTENIQTPEINNKMVPSFNDQFPIAFPVLPKSLLSDGWNISENNITVELGLNYHFKGERWQPFVELAVAGNWGNYLISQSVYSSSPNIMYRAPSIETLGFPLEIRTGTPPQSTIPLVFNPNYNNISAQIKGYSQAVKMWYELNVGMKHNF